MKNLVGAILGVPEQGPVLTQALAMKLEAVQLCCWNPDVYTDARLESLRAEIDSSAIAVTSLWAGYPGPSKWNFVEGPETLGLVPEKYRAMRVDALKKAGQFAARLNLPAIVTHLGFVPENPTDPVFAAVVDAVRDIALSLREQGLHFWFETGQETPVTMLRLIEQVGTGNLGVNLDPANLILYGKGNPIDALDVFGQYVYSVHAKDGLYPTDPMKLGCEVKVGEGRVRFPELVKRLNEFDYAGAYIIEREISGEEQRRDIEATIGYLKRLLGRE